MSFGMFPGWNVNDVAKSGTVYAFRARACVRYRSVDGEIVINLQNEMKARVILQLI